MNFNDIFHIGKAKAKKQINDLIPPKKSTERIHAELRADLSRLEENYKEDIERQLAIRNNEDSSTKAVKNAEAKIELSLGALYLIKMAREDLYAAHTSTILAENMRDLGEGLRIINRVYSAETDVKWDYLNKQIRKMNDLAGEVYPDKNVKDALRNNSMEKMGDGWQQGVNQVLSEGISAVDDFIKKSGRMGLSEQAFKGKYQENDSHADYMNQFKEYEPGSKAVEDVAENIYRNAEDLEAWTKYTQDMKDMD